MNHHPFAILVHDQPYPLESLKPVSYGIYQSRPAASGPAKTLDAY